MEEILTHVRPRLLKLGDELALELAHRLRLEFFPHVARHARRTVNPPPETWCAFGPSAKGYKRYPYFALCISALGLHARVTVKPEADGRLEMARILERRGDELARQFRGVRISRYDNWNFDAMPAPHPASEEFWIEVARALTKKTGAVDIGFGWPIRDGLQLDRSELFDAYRELEPIYRTLRAAA